MSICRPKFEVAGLFRSHRQYLGPRSYFENKVIRALITCRTAKQGGHIYTCDNQTCSEAVTSYNSCRNRHCPKCQYSAKELWVENRVRELLPVPYYHMVFTVPHVLNELMMWNRKELFEILFSSSQKSVKKIFQSKYDARPGVISLLHTWGSNLSFHVHVHMLVTGGGLSLSRERWIPAQENYALPVKALSDLFRALFLAELRALKRAQKLRLPDHLLLPGALEDLLDLCYQKDWVVYAKKPFAAPIHVLNYLGNYTHRVAFSNHRIKAVDSNQVYFEYKDYRDGTSLKKVTSLPVPEFLRRYLMHTLPRRFVKIRFFGFMAHRDRKGKVAKARELIAKDRRLKQLDPNTLSQIIIEYQLKHCRQKDLCPKCGLGTMRATETLERRYFDSS